MTSRDSAMTSHIPQPRIPHGPKPITPKNAAAQKSNLKVVKPKTLPPQSEVMKPVFRQSLPTENSNCSAIEKGANSWKDDDMMTSHDSVMTSRESEICSDATSDISSIVSFESTEALHSPDQIPVPTEPNESVSKSRDSVSKSREVLPSQRIEKFIRDSKYLYARSPSHGPSSQTRLNSQTCVKKSTSEHDLRVVTQRSDKRKLGPPVTTRHSLRKSHSSQHTNTLQKTNKNLSPHLMYGIFNGTARKVKANVEPERERESLGVGGVRRSKSTMSYGGLRRSSSSLSVNSLRSENSFEVRNVRQIVLKLST